MNNNYNLFNLKNVILFSALFMILLLVGAFYLNINSSKAKNNGETMNSQQSLDASGDNLSQQKEDNSVLNENEEETINSRNDIEYLSETYSSDVKPEIVEGKVIDPISEIEYILKKVYYTPTPKPVQNTTAPKTKSVQKLTESDSNTGSNYGSGNNNTSDEKKWTEPVKFLATAYSGGGFTYTGTKPTPKRTLSVDPNVIPLGSKVKLTFFDGWEYLNGIYTAEDIGSAVKGKKVDVYVSDESVCDAFGIRSVLVQFPK